MHLKLSPEASSQKRPRSEVSYYLTLGLLVLQKHAFTNVAVTEPS